MSVTDPEHTGRIIRKARPDDADAVRGVVLAAYQRYVPIIGSPPGPMLDDYAARIAADQTWVLSVSGSIAAVLVLEETSDSLLLDNIAVHPDYQGLGLGRALLDFAETQAIARGRSTVTLYTNALMRENIAIYGKRGYVTFDQRREKGFDRVYMRKRLGA